MVRYCPECGHVGEPTAKRGCCPDGNHAFYVPIDIAMQAKHGFEMQLKEHDKDAK